MAPGERDIGEYIWQSGTGTGLFPELQLGRGIM
jgi:hypothetical protein